MDDKIHSAINQSYDEIVPERVTEDAGRHPELSTLFKIEQCEGRLLPPFLLTAEAVSKIMFRHADKS